MCTLTWWRDDEGAYEVFFNRDEKKTRSCAEVPLVREESGVRFLSPRDPDGGGTWMLANEFGVTVCLLNRWHEEREKKVPWISRGRLVWSLAREKSAATVIKVIREMELDSVRPFSLWAFDEGKVCGVDWTQGKLKEAEPSMPVTSSSYCFEEVLTARVARFAELEPHELKNLADFHGSAGEESSAFTVRMCRPDAQTMSRSRVRVTGAEVHWEYLEEARDLAGEVKEALVTLRRH